MNSHRAFNISVLVFLLLLALSGLSSPVQARPKVAVVLGGGAARGISHIGLLKAFEENGIPVDIVVGTSMGSIVGGLYAAGFSPAEIEFLVRKTDFAELFSFSFPPKGGFINPRRFEAFLDSLLENKRFEDLRLPFYAVITNPANGEEVALREGPVARGILASMSIPAVFPPVEIGGKYFIDGGMKNAVPANVARQMGADVVIGVNINRELEKIDYNSILNNVQLALYLMIDGYTKLNEPFADLMIVPDVKYDSYMAYSRVDYFIQKGYEAAVRAMPRIKEIIAAKDPNWEAPLAFASASTSRPEPETVNNTTASLQQKLAKAYARAAAVPPDFSVYPILEPEFGTRAGVEAGIGLGGGIMGPFTASYRYQWDFARPESSHRTTTLAYSFGKEIKAELYLKQFPGSGATQPARQPARQAGVRLTIQRHDDWRLRSVYEVPVGDTAGAESALDTAGTPLWLVSANKQQALRWPWTVELGLEAGRQRLFDVFALKPAGVSERSYAGTAGYFRATGGLKHSLSKKGISFWETGIAYPYLLVQAGAVAFQPGTDGAASISGLVLNGKRQVELGAGAGVDVKLFGLYPLKLRFLAETAPGAGQWSWSLRFSEAFALP